MRFPWKKGAAVLLALILLFSLAACQASGGTAPYSGEKLAFPLFQEFEAKAVISIMVFMQDHGVTSFLSWDMCREMSETGLVEIGSHAYALHNLDDRGGNFTPDGVNGVQRKPEETDEDFKSRVLDDIQKSYDLIEENVGAAPVFFAYPFGLTEPDADGLIGDLFPVTAVTLTGTAELSDGLYGLHRYTVTMDRTLKSILQPPLKAVLKSKIKEFLGR